MNPEFFDDIDAIIFDMDGLMLDTERAARKAWTQAMHDFGYELPKDVYHQMIGRNRRDKTGIFNTAFGSGFPLEKVGRRKDQYLYELLESDIPLKPGLMPLLRYLQKTPFKTAVASSTLKFEVSRRLHLLEFEQYFDAVVGGDEVDNGKPHPDIFLAAASSLGVLPEHCLVLEDSEAGVRAASSAGMKVFMVPDVKAPSEEIKSLLDGLFDSLNNVLGILKEPRINANEHL